LTELTKVTGELVGYEIELVKTWEYGECVLQKFYRFEEVVQ
jgi:hypothetical protein